MRLMASESHSESSALTSRFGSCEELKTGPDSCFLGFDPVGVDGWDGRKRWAPGFPGHDLKAHRAGQVIVIGATNRPDAVDSALRRPGRFDREFYFPLPNKDARKKIIGINTRKWEPPLSDEFLDHLAGMTKGYGGADLRVSQDRKHLML